MFNNQIVSLLEFLQSYQSNFRCLEWEGVFNKKQLEKEYNNWLRLLNQLENPLEKEFFRKEWIPFVTDDLCVFIDSTDNDMAIFQTNFFFYEPFQWYKIYLFDNINELIDNIKEPELLRGIYTRFKKRDIDMVHSLCLKNNLI